MSDHIKDPLVRLAFEARRRVQELENGVQLAERDLAAAQNGLEQAVKSHAITKAELTAVMDVLTDEQQSDLILEELMHRQQVHSATNPVMVRVMGMINSNTKQIVESFRKQRQDNLGLLNDIEQETTLSVHWSAK